MTCSYTRDMKQSVRRRSQVAATRQVRNWRDFVAQVFRCGTMNNPVHYCCELEVDALPDWKPVEFSHRLGNVVSRSEIGDESGSSIHDSL